MVKFRQNRMIQPWPPSTTSTVSSRPSPTASRGERQSKPIALDRSSPTASPSSSSSPRGNPAGQRTPGTAGNSPARIQPAAQQDGRPSRKPRRQRLRAKGPRRVISQSAARFELNPPPDGAPERPRNSTAISTDQRCRKYCEGRSRPPRVTQAPRPPAVDPC